MKYELDDRFITSSNDCSVYGTGGENASVRLGPALTVRLRLVTGPSRRSSSKYQGRKENVSKYSG